MITSSDGMDGPPKLSYNQFNPYFGEAGDSVGRSFFGRVIFQKKEHKL